MVDARPRFDGKCHMCLKCIYNCQAKALRPGILKSIVLKDGYDLMEMRKELSTDEIKQSIEMAKGIAWAGVRKYLVELIERV